MHHKVVRDRQFVNRPEQPAVVRQSYQDSDIFGTKKGRETVQPSATSNGLDMRMRESRNFAPSDVLGNEDRAVKQLDGNLHHAITTRNEPNWSSNVFAGAKPEGTRRKNLARGDAGRGGLYGD